MVNDKKPHTKGYWSYKSEFIHVGTIVRDGKVLPVIRTIAHRDKWYPGLIPHPILKGVWEYDLNDHPPEED